MFIVLFITTLCIGAANLSDVTHYEVLGVAKQASTQEIRQAYKKLAVKFHPDKNPDSKEQEMFLKITAAYETLKDPDKRHRYDTYGSYSAYTRKYDHHSQSEYNNLYYNGLYHEDPFVDTLSSGSFSNYLQDGLYFVNFYSPFCPPCQRLADTWKKLAEMYKGVIKVAAVNCKYYNNFCFSMRIGSYPSLLFYPNGKEGDSVPYRGERSLEALEQFVLPHVRRATGGSDRRGAPAAYVLRSTLDAGGLARMAYRLRGLVTLTVVEDPALSAELSAEGAPAVLALGPSRVPLSGDEGALIRGIVDALPTEAVDEDRFQRIMGGLREGRGPPWALCFSSEGQDRLPMHRLQAQLPDLRFGEVDCTRSLRLCLSLRVSPGRWAVLKRGGAVQRLGGGASDGGVVNGAPPSAALLRAAAAATALHSLDEAEFKRILDGEEGTWALLVLPRGRPAEPLAEQFTRASLHFAEDTDIRFGIMECAASGEQLCGSVVGDRGGVVLQKGAGRHHYAGPITEGDLADFLRLVKDTEDMELSEQQVLELMSPEQRGPEGWLVGFFPQGCGGDEDCARLLLQWRMVAQKLRALPSLRVGLLRCGGGGAGGGGGVCPNVRTPSARYYAPGEDNPHTASLQQLSLAPHMEQWALRRALAPPLDLGGGAFAKHVEADALRHGDLRPWLVYFHSPRCFRCHEMYADFVIAGHLLGQSVQLGTVNCWSDRGLCQRQQVLAYPALRLLRRGRGLPLQVSAHRDLLGQLRPLLRTQEPEMGASLGVGSYVHVAHDEF